MDNNTQPLDKSLQKDLQKYDDSVFTELQQQIDYEYQLSWVSQFAKLSTILTRLKLYNNQRKDKDAVGDVTMFTTLQTVLASLYDDELAASFIGRERGDEDRADNLTSLAQFDYVKMSKNILDYIWMWDTLFYGRGLVEMMEFDRDKEFLCPLPSNIDPATFLHDPKASSVNGLMRGKGGMRFGGYELWLKKEDISDQNGYENYKYLRSENEMKSLLQQSQQAREDAQNVNYTFQKDMEANLGDNKQIAGLKWFTHWKGKKVMVILAQQRKRIIKYHELEYQKKFPIIDRPMFPTSNDWNGTSIPDLTEDKQRQKSVALNLGLNAMKSDLYPHYLYDEDRVKNKGDLLKFGFNKFTGIVHNDGKDIRNAVTALNKPAIRMDMVNFVLNALDASVQKATATPDMQSGGVEDQKRTLGELNLVASKVDVRYSLSAKVFGWSEAEFWRQWYQRYKENFVPQVDEKIIRLVGVQGYSYIPLMRDDFITNMDPDIEIESKVLSEAKMTRERILMQQFGLVVYQDPTANKTFFNRKLAKLNGLKKDEIDLLYPPSIDELTARKENLMLDKNKMVQVHPLDDDIAHLAEHEKAEETKAKEAHIEAHYENMRLKKQRPDLYPQPPADANGQPQPGQPGQPQPGQAGQGVQNNLNPSPSQAATNPLAQLQ